MHFAIEREVGVTWTAATRSFGVLRGIERIRIDCGGSNGPSGNPFTVMTGTSAGAINASALAAHADEYPRAVDRLHRIWHSFQTHDVYRADALLTGMVPLERIPDLIHRGVLRAFAITASCSTAGTHVTFYTATEQRPWVRSQCIAVPGRITLKHLLASSAVTRAANQRHAGSVATGSAHPFDIASTRAAGDRTESTHRRHRRAPYQRAADPGANHAACDRREPSSFSLRAKPTRWRDATKCRPSSTGVAVSRALSEAWPDCYDRERSPVTPATGAKPNPHTTTGL